MKGHKAVLCMVVLVVVCCLSAVSFAGEDKERGKQKTYISKTHGGYHKQGKDFYNAGIEDRLYHKAKIFLMHSAELGLSDEQVAEIKHIKLEAKKDMIMRKAVIEVIKVDIKEALWQRSIDVKAINQMIDKKYSLKKEKAKMLVKRYAELKAVLTEEQLKALKSIFWPATAKAD